MLPYPCLSVFFTGRTGRNHENRKSLLLTPDTVCGVYHPVKGHHHFPYEGQSVLLQSALVTIPVDDDTTPDPAAVIGAVIDSPSFSHMMLVHFLFSRVL